VTRRATFEALLLLVSFGALSLYAVMSLDAAAVQLRRGRELDEFARTGRPRTAPQPLAEGDLVGRIEIPRLNISTVILEGVSGGTLRVAAGHVPGTALPGDSANSAIAAHRDTFFRDLGAVRPGDRIEITTRNSILHYRAASIRIVEPDETSVLEPGATEALTLITCYPFQYVGPAPRRFIVSAVRTLE
jgi:sortase A